MINAKKITATQYSMISTRRLQYDNLLWQTPVMSMIGMSFLFQIALGNGSPTDRIIASALAFFAAVASAHLLLKHRYYEVYCARLLQSIEEEKKLQPINKRLPKEKGPLGWSAYLVWLGLLSIFAVTALAIGIMAFAETQLAGKIWACLWL
jgi:hypothetical protein